MTRDQIAARLERFIRANFGVADGDPGFSRTARLFEDGYVDSVGVVEMHAFLQKEFGVEIPDEAMVPEDFETIDDIARVVSALKDGTPD